jgi:DNA polymerase IIIc chi subunit
LHPLPGSKRAGELAKLAAKLYRERRRVVIWVADQGRLQILDDFLWTHEKLSFLPHAIRVEGADQHDEPILLTSEPFGADEAEVLVVGDGLPPGEWAATFAEIHDLIPPEDAGTERRAFWDGWAREHGVEVGGE